MTTPENGEVTGGDEAPRLSAAEELEAQRAKDENTQRRNLETRFSGFGYVVMPSDALPPILDVPTRRALHEWMAEMSNKKQLKAVGLEPRLRVMLDGPPGCGKTTLAHHVAARMGLPMVTIVANSIIDSLVGASAQAIGRVFREARAASSGVVLFFDEFDAIAMDRGKAGRHSNGHNEGVTISLLAELDRHNGMVFAATNKLDAVDPAVHRRFDLRINIGLPGDDERRAIVRLYLQPFEVADVVVDAIADELANASPALIKDMCEAIKRGLALGPKLKLSTGLGPMVRRAIETIQPHDGAAIPKLWGGVTTSIENLEAAAEGAWPPEFPA